ncbi:extracellular solute-binding protein [Streptomyces sp. TRM72054]|uniref:extracellular solute-binding protein n=1 Tax=Streptomyces sp. TRM72054 TaxID=2870562 RepID=UPI0021AB2DB0|nr:extracellular solute-binding protein [Streptomyces sp. TRM72054]
MSAGGAVAGAAALSGCALQVSSGVSGKGETVTVMVNSGDILPEQVKQAQKDLPYFAARDVAEELDPYFARSGVLGLDDLDPVNDLWRFDGRTQGRGPRYGMAKDFSQDSMYWYNAAAFDKAGVGYPPETEPVTYEEWLDNAKRLVQRKNGQTTVFGGSFNGLTRSTLLWRVFLPQSWPVLSASFIIAFTWTWGDYIAPQLLLSTDRTTLAVAVMTTYVNEGGTPVPELQAAASVMYVVPILLIFLVAQRGFVAGMSTSGLK